MPIVVQRDMYDQTVINGRKRRRSRLNTLQLVHVAVSTVNEAESSEVSSVVVVSEEQGRKIDISNTPTLRLIHSIM